MNAITVFVSRFGQYIFKAKDIYKRNNSVFVVIVHNLFF